MAQCLGFPVHDDGVFGMPELRLDDGTILALPDDATPAEIAEIVARHYRVAVPVRPVRRRRLPRVPETSANMRPASPRRHLRRPLTRRPWPASR